LIFCKEPLPLSDASNNNSTTAGPKKIRHLIPGLHQSFTNKENGNFSTQCSLIPEKAILLEGCQASPVCPFGKSNM
jgi:hypothetical protein